MIEKRLIKYIEELDNDIVRLRSREVGEVKNLLNESYARLLLDVRDDLLKILEDGNKNKY